MSSFYQKPKPKPPEPTALDRFLAWAFRGGNEGEVKPASPMPTPPRLSDTLKSAERAAGVEKPKPKFYERTRK